MSQPTITVLGSGCAKCKKLHELTAEAAKELGFKTEIGYSTAVEKIIELGAMSSPVLTVNDKIILEGSVPNLEEIKELLAKHAGAATGDAECCSGKDHCDVSCAPGSKSKDGSCCCGSC